MKGRKRYRGRNYHHLTPRSRHGSMSDSNLLLIYRDKHAYWHRLFGNKTLEEVIALLIRLSRIKGRRPEFVTLTMLGLNGNRMVGCEGKNDFDYCASCMIGKHCFMRTMFVFKGGEV